MPGQALTNLFDQAIDCERFRYQSSHPCLPQKVSGTFFFAFTRN